MADHELELAEVGKPVDYSFRQFKVLEEADLEAARESRIGSLPERSSAGIHKFLTKAVILNNNKLSNMKNLDTFLKSLIERPENLTWIDFSFNYITSIDNILLKYSELKIIYLHGNKISKLEQVALLRPLRKLRTLTFHGNPISLMKNYRNIVISLLPQLFNLDFTPITRQEKGCPVAAEAAVILNNISA